MHSEEDDLTISKEDLAKGYHWCPDWDYLLVGPNMDTAIVCSCGIPAIESWKKSEEGIALLRKMEDASEKRYNERK